jgi:hypothetical protein
MGCRRQSASAARVCLTNDQAKAQWLLIFDCAGQHSERNRVGFGLLWMRGYFHSPEHMFELLYCCIRVGTTAAVLLRPFVVLGGWVFLGARGLMCVLGVYVRRYGATGFSGHGTTAPGCDCSCRAQNSPTKTCCVLLTSCEA